MDLAAILRKWPCFSRGHYLLGLDALRHGNESLLLGQLRALELLEGEHSFEALHLKGEILLLTGQYPLAKDALSACLELDSTSLPILEALAAALVALEDFSSARSTLFKIPTGKRTPMVESMLTLCEARLEEKGGSGVH